MVVSAEIAVRNNRSIETSIGAKSALNCGKAIVAELLRQIQSVIEARVHHRKGDVV